MNVKNLICAVIFFLSFSANLSAQEKISVQAFNYNSVTRDTVVDFSVTEGKEYEKILMYYSMRCKDGLVSPPVAGQTNIGCGEWDYSCNTYIQDSSLIDSTKSTAPSHLIAGYSDEIFNYTTTPTYITYLSTQKEMNYLSTNSESNYVIGEGNNTNEQLFGDNQSISKSQHIYTAEELSSSGLSAGIISGMKIELSVGQGTYKNLRINMKNSNSTQFFKTKFDDTNFENVYYVDTEISGGEHFFRFHNPFDWNGTSSIIVEYSYLKEEGDNGTVFETDKIVSSSLYADASKDSYMELSGSGHVEVEHDFELSNEITVAFWNYGRPEQPINSSICEAVDDNNRRQMNIHLTWSNGQVYWDCGDDGGGYDRINKVVPPEIIEGAWHHWAFTKNAITGVMQIFIDGVLFHEGSGKTKAIDMKRLVVGRNAFSSNPHFGKIDDFQIWNTALSSQEIQEIAYQEVKPDHPNYADLALNYDFNDDDGVTVYDKSAQNLTRTLNGFPFYRKFQSQDVMKNLEASNFVPNCTFVRGSYSTNVSEIEVSTEIENPPYEVKEYEVIGTDLVLKETNYYYLAGEMPVFDESGNQVSSVEFPFEGIIYIFPLDYYSKQPSRLELMSFVTPYGINLDLGIDGKTWVFDVTDFAPVLNGSKRIYLTRGGQWQEDMDIRFEFIEGKPVRDVLAIQQIWPVTSNSYTDITSNRVFEPRDFHYRDDASMFTMKAAVTGHGQEGEFIPRSHFLNVNGGNQELNWQVWTECSENPIYPQGGTWIYDRAGWCPGAPTDVQRLDITDHVTPGETSQVDYGVSTASGDSRYIVNVQMISYGSPNYSNDAELVDIINPTDDVEHGRYNPICGEPKVLVRNNGSTPITELVIEYGVEGKEMKQYTWNGNLAFLEEAEVVLPAVKTGHLLAGNANFIARIQDPSGDADNNPNNNELTTGFEVVPQYGEDVIIRMLTNAAANETSYKVLDVDGNIIFSKFGGLSSFTTYVDTLKNLNGCFRLLVEDTDDDGISFWANGDGNGYVQIRSVNEAYQSVATDFGGFIQYDFVAGMLVGTNDLSEDKLIEVYPNPSQGLYNIDLLGFEDDVYFKVMNHMGQIVSKEFKSVESSRLYTYQVDLSDQPSGIYLLEIVENGRSRVEKLIKE